MNKPIINVPEMRFKGFTEDWEQRKLNELMNFSNGINASKDSYGKGRKMISVMDILDQSPLEYRNIRNSVDVPEKIENNKRVEKGDLVFVRSSEIPEEVGWAKAYFDDKFALYSGFSIRGKKKSAFDATFLERSLNSYGRKQIEQKAGGSTRFNVSQETLNSISVYTPDIFEQTKIGILFKQFDNIIALHQRKYNAILQLKKGYLQEMVPKDDGNIPDLRITNFEDNWEQKKLNNYIKYSSSNKSTNSIMMIKDGPYPVYDANKIIGYINEYDQIDNYISIIKDGAGVGRVTIRNGKSSIIATMGYLLPRKASIYFLFLLLQSFSFHKYITGTTIPHIYFKDYGKEKFYFPTIDEQKKISNLFRNIDTIADLYQIKIKKLKVLKESYLQKMFFS